MRFQKIKNFLWKVLGYQPFSWGSLLLIAGGVWTFFYIGKKEYDHLLVIVAAVAFGIIFLGFLGTILGAVYIRLRLREQKLGDDIEIVEGFSCQTGFVLNIPWWLPLAQCRWEWLKPDVEVEIMPKGERVLFVRRGSWSSITRQFWISDPFGIFRIRFVHQSARELLVKANPGRLEAPVFALGMQDGGEVPHPMGKPFGDRVDIRNYAPGDPVRYIIWKIYARTGELVVRKPEKALQPADRVLAYLISHPKDSACAGAAQATINAQSLGQSWRFGVDGSLQIAEEKGIATDLITQSAMSEAPSGEGLLAFLQAASDDRFRSLIVFAPPVVGSWLKEVITASKKVQVMVVIGIDGLMKPVRFNRIKGFVFPQEESPYSCILQKESLQEVLQELYDANISVQIADRKSGHIADAKVFQRVVA